jgi:putative membrane protein
VKENKYMFFIIVVAVAIVSLFSFWRPWTGYYGMMGMMGYGWGMMGYGWSWIFIFPLALMVIALGVYYLVPGLAGVYSKNDRSFEVLKERYAKGEITREQYLKMKKDIE